MPALSIALYGNAPLAFDNCDIYAIRAYWELLLDGVMTRGERLCNLRLKRRLGLRSGRAYEVCNLLRTSGVLNETAPQVSGLEVARRVKRGDHPKLVLGAADGNVVTLLDGIVWALGAQANRAVPLVAVNKIEDDDVSLVPLEVGRVSTQNLMLCNHRRPKRLEKLRLDKDRLLWTEQ